MAKIDWVLRWGMWMSRDRVMKGVWTRRDGGFIVRGHVTDPKTDRLVEILRALPEMQRVTQAREWLEAEMQRVRCGARREAEPTPLFCDFAVDLYKRKEGRKSRPGE